MEESSSEDEQEAAGPLHINVEVNLAESAESPPLGPPSLAPAHPAPIPVDELFPVWELPDDGTNFISFFTPADVLELKLWAEATRNRSNEEGYVVEEPVLPQNFLAFLIENHGTQCEVKFVRAAAEPLFAQLLSYVAGYARLTSHNKRIFRKNFESWSVEVKRAAEVVGRVGRLPRTEVSCPALAVVGGLLALGGLLYVLRSSLLYGFLPWSCTTKRINFGCVAIFFVKNL